MPVTDTLLVDKLVVGGVSFSPTDYAKKDDAVNQHTGLNTVAAGVNAGFGAQGGVTTGDVSQASDVIIQQIHEMNGHVFDVNALADLEVTFAGPGSLISHLKHDDRLGDSGVHAGFRLMNPVVIHNSSTDYELDLDLGSSSSWVRLGYQGKISSKGYEDGHTHCSTVSISFVYKAGTHWFLIVTPLDFVYSAMDVAHAHGDVASAPADTPHDHAFAPSAAAPSG